MKQLILLLLIPVFGFTQVDTIDLESVLVESERIETFSVGSSPIVFSKEKLNETTSNSFATLIGRESSIYLKKYSSSGLSTASIRGSSSGQIAILWNGINVNNAVNGLNDLNIISLNGISSIKIFKGGTSAFSGNGGIGGTISLNTLPNILDSSKYVYNILFGQYGRIGHSVIFQRKVKKGIIKIGGFYGFGRNDYPLTKGERDFQENAVSELCGSNFSGRFLLDNTAIRFAFSLQKSERQLPPNIYSSNSKARQVDLNIKSLVGITSYFNRSNIDILFGGLYNYLDYKSLVVPVSLTEDYYFFTRVNWNRKIYDLDISSGIEFNNNKVISTNYTETFYENILKVNLNAKYKLNDRFVLVGSLNKHLQYFFHSPIGIFLGMIYLHPNSSSLNFKITRDFRYPTYNDLYWMTTSFASGNKNLKHEESFGQELSFKRVFKTKGFETIAELSVFNSNSNDLINWELDQIWKPVNIDEVWSRGAELISDVSYSANNMIFNIKLSYQFLRSTKGKFLNKNTAQLVYVPRNLLGFASTIKYKNFGIYYYENYSSRRFLNSDNNSFLKGYSKGQVSLIYDFKFKRISMSSVINIDNIWDRYYELYGGFPLEPRNISLKLKMKYN